MDNIWIFIESTFIQRFTDDTLSLRSSREIIILETKNTTYQNNIDKTKDKHNFM